MYEVTAGGGSLTVKTRQWGTSAAAEDFVDVNGSEGSVVTGDSMRARGYGCTKRTGFIIYRMKTADWVLTAMMAALLISTITALCLGQSHAQFVPTIAITYPSWGLITYTCYLLIPTALHIKEAIQWHISRSKI